MPIPSPHGNRGVTNRRGMPPQEEETGTNNVTAAPGHTRAPVRPRTRAPLTQRQKFSPAGEGEGRGRAERLAVSALGQQGGRNGQSPRAERARRGPRAEKEKERGGPHRPHTTATGENFCISFFFCHGPAASASVPCACTHAPARGRPPLYSGTRAAGLGGHLPGPSAARSAACSAAQHAAGCTARAAVAHGVVWGTQLFILLCTQGEWESGREKRK